MLALLNWRKMIRNNKLQMIKFQNYQHYKLPISMNPLEYGKLIFNMDNKYIIQINKTNVVLITQFELINEVKLFREGELILEFKDHKIDDLTFIRNISNKKFTFKDYNLIEESTDKTINKLLSVLNNPVWQFKLKSLNYSDSNALIGNSNTLNKLGIRSFSTKSNIIKLRKIKSKNIWDELVFNVNNKVFTKTLFENIINKFWNQVESQFTNNNYMFILLKVKYINNEYSTIGKLQKLNKIDKNWYIEFVVDTIIDKSDYYKETQIESIIISYGFKDGKAPLKDIFKTDVNLQNYNNTNLIISYNPKDYGILLNSTKFKDYTLYFILGPNGNNFVIKQFDGYNEIEMFKWK